MLRVPPLLRAPAALLAPIAIAACTGVIGGDAPPDSTGSTTSSLCATAAPNPGAAPLRRLTRAQYNNVVRDLLGDKSQPANAFPPDDTLGTFSNNATTLTVSPLLAQAYETAAESLSALAVASPKVIGCDPVKDGEDACAKTFIATFGKRAYRRPLSDAEVTTLFALYTDNRAGADFGNGIQAVVEAMLQSAPFLYQVEAGDLTQNAAGVVPLNSWEMASRLSFFLWSSMPDDALFAAAQSDALRSPDQIDAQARRMLADPRAHDTVADFFAQWLKLDTLATNSKDPSIYANFSPAMRASMRAETAAFVDDVFFNQGGSVNALLTSTTSFVDANTAQLYGISGITSMTPQKTQLDATQRSGILTQPSVLAIFAKPNQSSPVLRGKWVRERFLCQPVNPPPPNLKIVPPDIKPGESTRSRFAQHDKDPFCATCHQLMDPIGFGFEHYDGVGAWRAVDQGQPVDATGNLVGSDVDGAFDGAIDLAGKLSQSQEVKDCVATEWFRYAFGRGETQDDQCSLQSLKDDFKKGNYDMRELLVAMTKTAAFRYRPVVMP